MPACCAALESRSMRRVSVTLAAAAAEQLGGAEVVGREVRSDTDMAMAVDLGFTVEAIDALKKRGGHGPGNWRPHHQAPHTVAPPGEPEQADGRGIRSCSESGAGLRARREDLRQSGQGRLLASQELEQLGRSNPHGTHPDRRRRPHRGESHGAQLLGRARLMRMWRLSGADDAERFDGGFGLHHDGRWNSRGRPIT